MARLDGERPNAKQFHHHRDLFRLVQQWYDHFGVPEPEAKLSKYVPQFLEWIDEQLEKPELPQQIPFMAFVSQKPDFAADFIGKGYTSFWDCGVQTT